MIVYKNTSKGFIEDVENNRIARKIKESVLESFKWNKVNQKEENSWINSMEFMGKVIRKAGIADDCGILIEYNLPSTSLRVDLIISGEDKNRKPSFIIVELKQWKTASSTTRDGIVYTDYFNDTPHPSYQAYSYKLYLKDFNESIYNSSITAHSCAYLHNYEEQNPEPLKAEIYSKIVRDSPLYFIDDQQKLEEFIKKYVGEGNGGDILYRLENGNIRPSKKLINHVAGLFKGNQEFVLLDNQKTVYETVKETALTAKKKTVIIVTGGPGTGKSVISMNLLGQLLAQKNTMFVAPNASFREVMISKLTKEFDAQRIKHLLKGSSAFYGARKNTFDVVVVDEAHRLKDETAYMYKGKNQVEDMINAGLVSIFFVDEKQMIRPNDIGSIAEIIKIAEKHEAQVHRQKLSAQFRCSGAEGYINWIDDVLHLEETANYNGWDKGEFEFKIFDSPVELKDAIAKKCKKGFDARLLAGYAWPWTAANKGNANAQVADVNIPEFNFSMPWNSRSLSTKWAIDPNGVNQVGCVHTSQGLEFDYVGVIIGNDLQYDEANDKYLTTWANYMDSEGKKTMKERPDELNRMVRNIYRILLSRGMKGCYVYFVNQDVRSYFLARLLSKKWF